MIPTIQASTIPFKVTYSMFKDTPERPVTNTTEVSVRLRLML